MGYGKGFGLVRVRVRVKFRVTVGVNVRVSVRDWLGCVFEYVRVIVRVRARGSFRLD